MLGQYDIGFGSISGNELNPLDFVSVLSSDPVISGEFTLNWGTNTNNPDADILVYNGMRWSYDALWQAANGAAVVVDGANSPVLAGTDYKLEGNKVTISADFNLSEGVTVEVQDLVVFACADLENGSDYKEYSLYPAEGETSRVVTIKDGADGKYEYEITLTDAEIAWLKEKYEAEGNLGIDVYYKSDVVGVVSETLTTINLEFPAA